MQTSIIIRVKNEAENLKKLFSILKNQTFQDFEIIIVNDNSTDNSEKIVFDYFPKNRIKIINIFKGRFTYPFASNLGAAKSEGEFLVYLSAHSFPIGKTWLSNGLKNFDDPKVAGVFAYPLPSDNENFIVKTFHNFWTRIYSPKYKEYKSYKKGVLGTSNAIIRKGLWEKYKMNEKYETGGEDADWARHFLKLGYLIIQDHEFRVFHSHRLSTLGFIKQSIAYYKMANPQELSRKN